MAVVSAPATWLVAIVGASALVRSWISVGVSSPWILPDEVLYSSLARSVAGGELPSVRGMPALGWGVVYPTVISPAWAVFDDPFWAYHASLIVNSIVMSAAAVPAYLLARMFVTTRASLLVALMTVVVPSMSYTGAVMTENAFYPLFLFTVLAIARTVARPTFPNQLAVLLLLGLLVATRVQGAALIAAYAAAIGIGALTSACRPVAFLRLFVPTLVAVLLLTPLPAVGSLLRGHGLFGWLGGRQGTFSGFRVDEVPQWLTFLFADLVLYVAVVPIAATLIVFALGLSRRADERSRLFTAVALPVFGAMLLTVAFVSASFDVDGVGNLNERYVFYVVPLAFVGLALWIENGLPRPRPAAWILVATCCLVTALLPIDRLDYNAGLQALALLPWGALPVSELGLAMLVGGFTLACGIAWLIAGERTAPRLWLLTGAVMVLLGVAAVESNSVSASKLAESFEGRSATWVDDAVPADARVVALWDERVSKRGFYFWLIATEFFNKSVADVYRLGPATEFENVLPTEPVTVRRGAPLVGRNGRPIDADYVLASCLTRLDGGVVASSARDALVLVRIDGQARMSTQSGCSRREP